MLGSIKRIGTEQFIFPRCLAEDAEAGVPAVVCIDFAFALQQQCLCHAPVGQDWQRLKDSLECALGVEMEFVNAHFAPRDEWQW